MQEAGADLSQLDDLVPRGVFLQVAESVGLADDAFEGYIKRARETTRVTKDQRATLQALDRQTGAFGVTFDRARDNFVAGFAGLLLPGRNAVFTRAIDQFYEGLPGARPSTRPELEGQGTPAQALVPATAERDRQPTPERAEPMPVEVTRQPTPERAEPMPVEVTRQPVPERPAPMTVERDRQPTPERAEPMTVEVTRQPVPGRPARPQATTAERDRQDTRPQAAPTTIEITNNFNLEGTTVGATDVAREVERTVFQSVAGREGG